MSSTTWSPSSTSMVAGVHPHIRASTLNVLTAPVAATAGVRFEYMTAAGTRTSMRPLIKRMSLRTTQPPLTEPELKLAAASEEQRMCHAREREEIRGRDARGDVVCGVLRHEPSMKTSHVISADHASRDIAGDIAPRTARAVGELDNAHAREVVTLTLTLRLRRQIAVLRRLASRVQQHARDECARNSWND